MGSQAPGRLFGTLNPAPFLLVEGWGGEPGSGPSAVTSTLLLFDSWEVGHGLGLVRCYHWGPLIRLPSPEESTGQNFVISVSLPTPVAQDREEGRVRSRHRRLGPTTLQWRQRPRNPSCGWAYEPCVRVCVCVNGSKSVVCYVGRGGVCV